MKVLMPAAYDKYRLAGENISVKTIVSLITVATLASIVLIYFIISNININALRSTLIEMPVSTQTEFTKTEKSAVANLNNLSPLFITRLPEPVPQLAAATAVSNNNNCKPIASISFKLRSSMPVLNNIDIDLFNKIRLLLQQFPNVILLVEGYSDAVGNERYNLVLSYRRAQAVARLIKKHTNIANAKIKLRAYGSWKDSARKVVICYYS
jgi:outer membrane protein OmpA-like peptidoglycan-associated protein